MIPREFQFTTSEAAFIADLPQRDVQKAFDEDWFDTAPVRKFEGGVRRCLGPAELVHLRLLKDVARYAVLQTEAKKLIHRQLRERIPERSFSISADKDNGKELRSCLDRMAERLKEPVQVFPILVDAAMAWEQITERLAEA